MPEPAANGHSATGEPTNVHKNVKIYWEKNKILKYKNFKILRAHNMIRY